MATEPPIYDEVSDSLAYEIALAIYKDSRLTGLDGAFYLGLIRVENPQLDHLVENWYGAVGLTQVVPRYWLGIYPECGEDLYTDVYTQVCYGARIFQYYFDVWGDTTLALYAYNGCTLNLRSQAARCSNFPRWVQEYTSEYADEL
jgi:soluble lytic murein transglycosylase-like protein